MGTECNVVNSAPIATFLPILLHSFPPSQCKPTLPPQLRAGLESLTHLPWHLAATRSQTRKTHHPANTTTSHLTTVSPTLSQRPRREGRATAEAARRRRGGPRGPTSRASLWRKPMASKLDRSQPQSPAALTPGARGSPAAGSGPPNPTAGSTAPQAGQGAQLSHLRTQRVGDAGRASPHMPTPTRLPSARAP